MSLTELERPVSKTPEWLEALENKRKRSFKLAHDVGAGAPCLVCKEGCKGLNLHFWRKLCIECKCRKEDHEIEDDEDYAQFEILFGAKKVRRTTLKFNTQDKSFDWIPPDVPPDLAVDYLNAIPESKVPISNSEGARYRKQQLEKQVPLHDVDPNACHNLSDKELREFEKYLDHLKSNVFGQGRIFKYRSPQMLKERLIAEKQANMTVTSGECKGTRLQGAAATGRLHLGRGPGCGAGIVPPTPGSHPEKPSIDVDVLKHQQAVSSSGTPSRPLNSLLLEKAKHSIVSRPHNARLTGAKPFHPVTPEPGDKGDNWSVRIAGQGSGPGSGPGLRTPSSFMGGKHPAADRQNNNALEDDNRNRASPPGTGSTPEEVPSRVSEDLLGKFPQLSVSSDEVPFVPVREAESVTTRKGAGPTEDGGEPDSFPAPPATCKQCLDILYPEEVVVQTDRAGDLALWHARCFVCATCGELLVDLMYFYHGGKVYCGRHYAGTTNVPRCHACDELIFVKEYTCAEGESYHVRHFCCFHCDGPLGGKQYVPVDNLPVCLDCYQAKYGKTCRTCGLAIAAGEQRVSWKDLDFHAEPECFRCTVCLKSLLGGRFVVRNSNTFCSKDCVQRFPE